MKSKKTYVVLAVATLMLTAGVFSASAYQGDYTKVGPNSSPERHEAMEKAFANSDYNAWKELTNGRGRVGQVINENNFSQFAEARRLGQAGDVAGADKIRAELGLRTSDGESLGMGHRGANGQGQGRKSGLAVGQGQRSQANSFVDLNGDGVCDNLK